MPSDTKKGVNRPKAIVKLGGLCTVLLRHVICIENSICKTTRTLHVDCDRLGLKSCREDPSTSEIRQNHCEFSPMWLHLVEFVDIVQNLATMLRRKQTDTRQLEFDEVPQAIWEPLILVVCNTDVGTKISFGVSIDNENIQSAVVERYLYCINDVEVHVLLLFPLCLIYVAKL